MGKKVKWLCKATVTLNSEHEADSYYLARAAACKEFSEKYGQRVPEHLITVALHIEDDATRAGS